MKYEHVKKEHDAEVNHICRTADIVSEASEEKQESNPFNPKSCIQKQGEPVRTRRLFTYHLQEMLDHRCQNASHISFLTLTTLPFPSLNILAVM